MKISILYEFREGDFGGGYQFLKALRKCFIENKVYENNPFKADVIIFNNYPFKEEYRFKQAYILKKNTKIIIHRVDGPFIKSRGKDFKIDKIIHQFNRSIADGTIFQSNWSKIQNYNIGMNKNRYEKVIHNAPDLELFNINDRALFSRNRKIKLIANSWSTNSNKGFDIYKFLDDNLDYSRYEMTFIGNSPIRFKNIKLIKPILNNYLAEQLKEHDIFIHAGINESCSNSLLEALNCGLPSIVINSGSNPELVENSDLLFNSKEELLEKIELVVKNYSYYQNKIKMKNIKDVAKSYYDFGKKIYNDYKFNNYKSKKIGYFKYLKLKIKVIGWNINKFGILNFLFHKIINQIKSCLIKVLNSITILELSEKKKSCAIIKKSSDKESDFDWIFNLKEEIASFLNGLKGKKRKGFYHYSLSGDYFGEKIKWGLGNTVFFLKIIYTLGLEKQYKQEIKDAINFIQCFQKKNGEINDFLVQIMSFPFRLTDAIKNLNFSNIRSQLNKRAETRQSFSALSLYGKKPIYKYKKFPNSRKKIDRYLNKLKWEIPWGAGSHFSHLLFFLQHSNIENKDDLIDYAIKWVNSLQNEKDGFWYRGDPSIQQKINGAMKVITGLKVANKINFNFPEKIIDNILMAINDAQACDNFNITYVLKYCNDITKGKYRYSEIKDFMIERLKIYKEYYHPTIGGFSFYKNRARDVYYNAYISRGKNEPDIHGTLMFLWGISIIVQVLGINDKLNFKEHIT